MPKTAGRAIGDWRSCFLPNYPPPDQEAALARAHSLRLTNAFAIRMEIPTVNGYFARQQMLRGDVWKGSFATEMVKVQARPCPLQPPIATVSHPEAARRNGPILLQKLFEFFDEQ